ncbi:hypothetical protein TRICHSKD4_5912 [Roseibium sp. TrichSKD4]|nr:hypothetical protein TRICHSKD4_5912 [Roseibium sp. TrichSKD4]
MPCLSIFLLDAIYRFFPAILQNYGHNASALVAPEVASVHNHATSHGTCAFTFKAAIVSSMMLLYLSVIFLI